MSIRIDGKKISAEIGEKLFLELQEKNLVGRISLGILCVGDDPASKTFINVKKKFGEKYGFKVNVLSVDLPDLVNYTAFKNQVISDLKKMQEENNAVIVQLPLPAEIKEYTDEILKNILPEKDVDNLNDGNFTAPIVLALEKVLGQVGGNLQTKVFGIVGLGQVVGMPIYNYLLEKKYNLLKITQENFTDIKKCDVVISGVGVPYLIKNEDIKDGAVLIDYGCSYADINGQEKMCGDFDPECFAKSSFYTPVPGCMGPLVVASLFEKVFH
jgi:methylenetetrahydrofolate dehydrogenase (NADP+)/methenyltetrahydrofolate cyclohydrolase